MGCLERGFCWNTQTDFAVTRLTVGVPNDLQMERNLTSGLSVVYQGHLTSLGPFRERSTPAHEKKTRGVHRRRWECRIAKWTTGKMLECKKRTRMQCNAHDDMIKCNTQANGMATTANNWRTPGASNPGRYNTPPLTRDLVPRS